MKPCAAVAPAETNQIYGNRPSHNGANDKDSLDRNGTEFSIDAILTVRIAARISNGADTKEPQKTPARVSFKVPVPPKARRIRPRINENA